MKFEHIFVLNFDEKLGPNFLKAIPQTFSHKGDFSLLARLLVKVGIGDNIPTKQLGGPITWEVDDTKLLYFNIILDKPDSTDERFRKHGQLTTIFIEFKNEISKEVLQSYKDIEYVINNYCTNPTLDQILGHLDDLKEAVDQILNKSTLLSLLNSTVSEDQEAYELLGIATDDGLLIAQTPDPPPSYVKAGFVSTLQSLSNQLVSDLLPNSEPRYYINYRKDRVTIAMTFSSLILYCYVNREIADLRGIENYIERLIGLVSEIRKIKVASKHSILGLVRTYLPEATQVLISSPQGLPIVYEGKEQTDDLVQLRLTGTIQALINLLFLESEVMKVESEEQIHIVQTSDNNLAIIGALSEKRAVAIITPHDKTKSLGEYVIRTKNVLKKVQQFYK